MAALDPGQIREALLRSDHPLGVQELLRALGLHPGEQTAVKRALRDLLHSGSVQKMGKRYFIEHARPPPSPAPRPSRATRRPAPPQRSRPARGGSRGDIVEGILHVHRDGFGFVHPLEEGRENIFLPAAEAGRALDHDRVKIEVLPGERGRTFGRLLEVVDRVREQAVGTYFDRGRKSFVVPHDQSLGGQIDVPPTQIARDGDLVRVRLGVGRDLLEEPGALFGEVSGSLGRPGEPSGEVLGIAFSQGFSDEFPSGAMDQADGIRLEVTREEWAGRRDLRDLKLVTIDGEDARDFDDAVYAQDRAGGWRLVVAIADVSHYVRDGSGLDREALRRATSVYLPNRVLPMLPERLSNGICSLKPSEDRLCMVADMQIGARGELGEFQLYPAVMRSAARCTYNEVQAVLDGQDVPHRNAFKDDFQRLLQLSRALTKMRSERGAIDFDLPETRIVLDEDGKPRRIERRDRKDAHRLVEECMLAANEAVAKFFQDSELPSIYRFHGEPDPEKLAAFAELAGAHGFHLGKGGKITSRDLSRFVEQLEGHKEQRALNQLLLRSMMQAVYSAEEIGHYGLAATHYLHFTSPIRRYPDLMVHRLLKAHWGRDRSLKPIHLREEETHALGAVALQSSERERAAMQVERDVFAYYATLMMRDRVGEEFAAVVSGVTDFGFFVELEKELAEGLVKVESLGAGVRFDERRHALVLQGGRSVTVGQRLTVRLLSANIVRRQLELEVVVFEGQEEVAVSSPHPGFDRLRRTAAEKRRPQGRKHRGRR
ncbi:MAG TPA: ribonuclease R [Myxococcaceae bacterium]